MSAIQYCKSVAFFQGAQGKFYVVKGEKYHSRFPIEWAHNHMTFSKKVYDEETGEETAYEEMTGPKNCGNCKAYGSIRGVFVGYCGNCLQNYLANNELRGQIVAPGLAVDILGNSDIWMQYPYMFGIRKSEIGDLEGAEVTDDGIDLDRLEAAILSAQDEADIDYDETICDNSHDDVSVVSDDATINS